VGRGLVDLPETVPRDSRGLARIRRLLVGDEPHALLWLTLPTALALAIDLWLRAGTLAGYALQGKAIYGSSLLISAAFWLLPSWIIARSFAALGGPRPRTAWLAIALLASLWVLPFATFCFGGQILYHRVFHSYMGRDTLRLGIALRGTVGEWFSGWGGPWLMAAMLLAGVLVTAGILWVGRRKASSLAGPLPIVPLLTFLGALFCFWTDNVDSRFLQAALPDTCFVHGVVHAVRMAVTGQWHRRQGVSMRTPAPLPALSSTRPRPPNVLVILTESVRADASCSDPPPGCTSPFFDDVVPDRVPMGDLTSQTPNTFSASVGLWTGLPPNADFAAAHSAPVLWELARAVGYRTAYLSSQNPEYEDFGTFTRRAGIDVIVTALDLGGMQQEQLGAPDERAVDATVSFVRSVPPDMPYFAVLHLSNTHAPYRVAPDLLPFVPQSADPLGNVQAFHNRYRDSVRMQERTLAALLRELRALPTWSDTAVIFVSDHGEQFREHGGLYHNHSLFDEEVRIPGWIAAGDHVMDAPRREALATYAHHRTYMQDMHETIVDLLGLEESRGTLPLATLVTGRSLLRPRGLEPTMLLATSTAVWEPDDARYGVMQGDHALFGGPTGSWSCFDLARDRAERSPHPAPACGDLLDAAKRAFADVSDPH
jgi:glucan phosphoethanolaminetransferase (alkaline phosphatase superfamily)